MLATSRLAHLAGLALAAVYFGAWACFFAWMGWRAFVEPVREMWRGRERRGFEVVTETRKG